MPNTDNKIKYGISKCYAAVATIATDGSATYGAPFAIPGAVSISLDAEGEQNIFYADDVAYYVTNGNAGYSGDLELAIVPQEFKTKILNEYEDAKGVLIEDYNAEAVHFALMFQFKGDQRNTLHCLYNCTCTRPQISGSTKEDTVEPQTETLTITAKSIYNTTLSKDIVKASTGKDVLTAAVTGWYSAVYQPVATT